MRLLVQPPQPHAQLLAHGRVERAERLVEQQHARLDGEGARERHALALAARELRRIAVGEAVELHEREQLVDARADLVLRPLADLEPERDVAAHGEVLERGVVLEDEADAALLRHDVRDVVVADHDPADVGHLEAGDDAQQGRLAAAARPEQRGERAVRDLDVDILECGEVAEALRDVLRPDGHAASWRSCAGFTRLRATRTMTAMRGQEERGRVGAGLVVVVPVALDDERECLGLADDGARDDGDRAVLAERACRGEHDAVGQRRADRRQRDAPERLQLRRPERRGGMLLLLADLAQHRYQLARDERQADERRRDRDRREREHDLVAVLGRATGRTSRSSRRRA